MRQDEGYRRRASGSAPRFGRADACGRVSPASASRGAILNFNPNRRKAFHGCSASAWDSALEGLIRKKRSKASILAPLLIRAAGALSLGHGRRDRHLLLEPLRRRRGVNDLAQ